MAGLVAGPEAVLDAVGSVSARHLADARVVAGYDIEIGALAERCELVAGRRIGVSGNPGLLIGGLARPGRLLTARRLLASAGRPVVIRVGFPPFAESREELSGRLKFVKSRAEAVESEALSSAQTARRQAAGSAAFRSLVATLSRRLRQIDRSAADHSPPGVRILERGPAAARIWLDGEEWREDTVSVGRRIVWTDDLGPVAEQLPIGLLLLGPKGALVRANSLALSWLSLDARVVGRPDFPETLEAGPFRQALLETAGDQRSVEFRGGTRVLHADVRPLGDGDRLVSIRDVTAVAGASQLRRSIVNEILHRLRTRLTTILSVLSMGSGGRVPEKEKLSELLDMGKREAERLSAFVGRLRDLFLVETGSIDDEIDVQPVKLSEVVGRVVKGFGPRFMAKGQLVTEIWPAGALRPRGPRAPRAGTRSRAPQRPRPHAGRHVGQGADHHDSRARPRGDRR